MGRQLYVRLVQTVISLLGMSLLIFVLVRASGDPVDLMRTSTTTEAEVANIRQQWGLDKSLPEQYVTMMRKIFTGDLVSYNSRLNVDEQIRKGIPATFSLCVGAAVIWMAFGILFGYLSAVHAGRFADRAL